MRYKPRRQVRRSGRRRSDRRQARNSHRTSRAPLVGFLFVSAFVAVMVWYLNREQVDRHVAVVSPTGYRLFLVPVDDMDVSLVRQVAGKLQKELQIPVTLSDIQLPVPSSADVNLPGQVSANDFLRSMRARIKKGERDGYIAFITRDLGNPEVNFYFACSATDGLSVVSCARFQINATRKVLLERLVKQCISSTGLLFKLPRCSDRFCARAFPGSLKAFDRKGAVCNQCRRGFEKLFQGE